MQVLKDRTLVVRTRFPARITETIPTSNVVKDLGEERYEVEVPWDWDNAEKLTHMRIKDVPSPIQRDYQWPRPMGFEPFDHQKDTSSFLSLRRRAFCFNEQGRLICLSLQCTAQLT